MSTVPTFLVIGAARSGTTALIEGIRRHPRVFVTHPKEPHYFALHGTQPAFTAPGDATTINRVATTRLPDYLALYPAEARAFDALGEGSVSTLYHHAHAIPEIGRVTPQARLVVILRDPVDRAKSAYDYLVSKGHETAPTLLDAVVREEQRIAAGYHHLWHYVAMGHYAESLGAFLKAFGDGQVGVWFYEDLIDDYAQTLQEVLRFIGTDPAPNADQLLHPAMVNVSGTPRSRLATRALRVTAGHGLSRAIVRRGTTFAFRERVRRLVLRKEALDPAARASLLPLFEQDLSRLRDLLGDRPLPRWLRPREDER